MKSLAIVWQIYRRTWLKVLRRPPMLLVSFVQPLIWMAFFGFLFHRFSLGDLEGKVTYLEFLMPGVCGMTILLGSSQSGIGFIRDMQTQFLERMGTTPAGNYYLLFGKISADVSRLLLQATVVCLLGVALGARLRIAPGSLLAALACVVLFASAYCCLSCCLALFTRSQESLAALVHVVNMPLFFTSSALVPKRQMPHWLESVAAWNPFSMVVELLRNGLVLDRPVAPITSLTILLAVAVVLFFVTLSALKMATWRAA